MPSVRSFTILPALPDSLQELETLARNMFWAWNSQFVEVFKRIDASLWTQCGHNPVKLLGSVSQTRLEALAKNESFLVELKRAGETLRSYLHGPTWYEKVTAGMAKPLIAYFSAEFGLHECLPIYAGGLGILAGDHLKSASDLGIPLVGVGLMYQKGYFRQRLNVDGWQQEEYAENDPFNMPIDLVRTDDGRPLTISIEYPGRVVQAQVWSIAVGRIKLYLLDTNIAVNSPVDRMITSTLYGGDRELRIRQEVLLGIGGLRALLAMGLEPTVCHMNEGHAAFMALERIRQLRNTKNMTFEEAVEATRASNVFTVHTLVKAGLDEFDVDLMDKYFGNYFPHLGTNRKQFLTLGRMLPDDENEAFKMPVLAIRLSGYINGVSKLHGEISREVWGSLWPSVPAREIPITSITNGIHLKTWLSDEMGSLYNRYLGPTWSDSVFDKSVWDQVNQIPDEEMWSAHQRCKEQLIAFARKRLASQLQRRGRSYSDLKLAEEVLAPDVLTIGFARRFASYKRGDLFLKDPQRIAKLLNDSQRPIQFIFAGKAHPKDTGGKEIIRHIVKYAGEEAVRRRILFLEDYDIDVARFLVKGVDVWLNNPRRPMEASGTSGMKAAVNGVLNMSTADGWWPEGYTPDGGWVIGDEQDYQNPDYQDTIEAQAIYGILENEVGPLFYQRSPDGLPRAWIQRMRSTIRWVAPRFNTHRMVAEYARRFYNPAAARHQYLASEAMIRAKAISQWKSTMREAWPGFAVKQVLMNINGSSDGEPLNPRQPELKVGSELNVRALVKLGRVKPEDVSVELYHGPTDSWGNIQEGTPIPMAHEQRVGEDGEHWFAGRMACTATGHHGVTVRVLPSHPDQISAYDLGLILWEKG
jgi:glycogen phosphorylase